ncbi:ATP-dependent DNA ligase [Aulographum hederae CBS 113979]|uniref:DNA ligase n=1 Tax=Aulographum hederae CBS 113979 TaxID=1176131 RepID=A0A6G1H5G3_9PEZI|nr:ATP-dependent DNA ligase [Aulographum hederae CBS 113979]
MQLPRQLPIRRVQHHACASPSRPTACPVPVLSPTTRTPRVSLSTSSSSTIVLFARRPTANMAPRQGTLNRFFGKSGEAQPPKQQSKLAFGTKAKAETEEKKPKEEPAVEKAEDDASEAKEEIKSEDDPDVVMEDVEKDGSDAADATTPITKPSKRPAADDEDGSDVEPPVKKPRKSPKKSQSKPQGKSEGKKGNDKKKANGPPSATKPSPNVQVKTEKKDTSKSNGKAAAAKKPAKRGKSRVIEEDDEDEDGDAVVAAEASSQQSPPAEPASEHEDDEAESEEEKPEIAAKKREKVQTTFKTTTKDPYPDWKAGEPVPYAALCTTFSKIEMTTKRLEISAYCSLFLRQVLRLTPNDLVPTILLMINKLAADYAGIELGIGESLIMKAIGDSTGRSLQVIKADQNEIGDLGLVAAKSRGKQPTMFKPKPLTVAGVHKALLTIATIEGHGSQGRKIADIKKLLSAADVASSGKNVDITKDKGGPSEAKFIVRTLEGKLRLGLADKTVVVALAHAIVYHEASAKGKEPNTEQLAKGESILKSVYSEIPSYEVIVPAVLDHGMSKLRENCKLQPGVPLKPMLAKPTKSITEVLDRFEGKHFTCEYKYDGERAQIHYVANDSTQEFATAVPQAGKIDKGIANIFSRNSEDLSKKYPDILGKLSTWVKGSTKSFVLDCETVAWDVEEKKVLPFQQLMTRKKKDVKVEDVKVKVCVFAFDMLFLNGEALVNKPFRERRDLLHDAFNEVQGEFSFARYGDTSELEEIQVLLEDSVKASCEGLMVKMLDGPESSYEPSKRSQNWLKVKKDYLSGIGDSLDLVVLGAYFGKGKRTSVYGAFLLACWNPSAQVFETVCNIGTGFSEATLEQFHSELKEEVIDKPKPFYSHSTGNKDQPDVWFEAKQVWEVKTADLTLSPRYKAAADQLGAGTGKGVSLRFPRFVKVRDDKKSEQATTSRQIAEMYQRQESVAKNKGPAVDDDFEY